MSLLAASILLTQALLPPVAIACESPRVIDGDTIACASGLHLRLSGIDAPEMPGHCRPGRTCAPGNPVTSRARLRRAIGPGPVMYRPLLVDLYGRTVALAYAGPINLSCSQLSQRQAIYVARWDEGGHVKRECGL